MSNNKVYKIVTDRIIEKLESGVIPWERPWNRSGQLPANATNGRNYSGVNLLLLGMMGFSNPYYLTFNQAKKAGGNVKKGEKSIPVIFWKLNFYDKKSDKRITEQQAQKAAAGTVKTVPILRYYNVFNVDQCENLDESKIYQPPKIEKFTWNSIQQAEQIAAGYKTKPEIKHGGGRACYIPGSDIIRMPEKDTFKKAEGYYTTLFHEMIHSTGHSSRLSRDMAGSFGTQDYGKEELIAEIGAAFLNHEAKIFDYVIDNSAAYINNWLQVFRDPKNTNLIVNAAANAQKAADYILNK